MTTAADHARVWARAKRWSREEYDLAQTNGSPASDGLFVVMTLTAVVAEAYEHLAQELEKEA